jgi:tRNA(Arg) A34 adenosine deaminase TadA
MNENDLRFMRVAIDAARKARDKGNHPFGAVLVDEQGHILM